MASEKIKYIFCISTGRCGTDYLNKLLATLDGCNSFHEQRPRLHKEVMREYLKGLREPVQRQMPEKIAKINSSSGTLYSDTSHIFIKSFGWEIPEYISQEEIGVIILKRDKDEVAESTHRTQSGPFNDLGRDWIIVPNGNNILKPPLNPLQYKLFRIILKIMWKIKRNSGYKRYPSYFKKHSIKLIKWYYEETYALAEKYKKDFPKITYVEVTLTELNSFEGFEKIIQTFKLEEFYDREKINDIIGKPINLKILPN